MDYRRGALKRRAKEALKSGSYWTGFGLNLSASLMRIIATYILGLLFSVGILGVFGGLFGGLFSRVNPEWLKLPDDRLAFEMFETAKTYLMDLGSRWIWLAASQAVVFLLGMLLRSLLLNPLRLGQLRWFSRNREQAGPARFSHLFDFFAGGNYKDGAVGAFRYDLQMFLWGLPVKIAGIAYSSYMLHWMISAVQMIVVSNNRLMIETHAQLIQLKLSLEQLVLVSLICGAVALAGIVLLLIKHYSLGLTPWLLADNPHLRPGAAMRLSKNLMRGFKWHRFVLDLSFIGYYCLLILTAPFILITAHLLSVYQSACAAEFYALMREKGRVEGVLRMEDLGFVQQVREEPLSATAFYSERQNP